MPVKYSLTFEKPSKINFNICSFKFSKIPLIKEIALSRVSRRGNFQIRDSPSGHLNIFRGGVFVEELRTTKDSRPSSERGHVLRSDKRPCLGMQMLNELMKIKNGRGGKTSPHFENISAL